MRLFLVKCDQCGVLTDTRESSYVELNFRSSNGTDSRHLTFCTEMCLRIALEVEEPMTGAEVKQPPNHDAL